MGRKPESDAERLARMIKHRDELLGSMRRDAMNKRGDPNDSGAYRARGNLLKGLNDEIKRLRGKSS